MIGLEHYLSVAISAVGIALFASGAMACESVPAGAQEQETVRHDGQLCQAKVRYGYRHWFSTIADDPAIDLGNGLTIQRLWDGSCHKSSTALVVSDCRLEQALVVVEDGAETTNFGVEWIDAVLGGLRKLALLEPVTLSAVEETVALYEPLRSAGPAGAQFDTNVASFRKSLSDEHRFGAGTFDLACGCGAYYSEITQQ